MRHLIGLSAIALTTLTACGGGGGGGLSSGFSTNSAEKSAALSTTDEAANAVASLVIAADIAAGFSDSANSASGNAKSNSGPQSKALTQNCSDGGTATLRDDDKVEFDNCVESEETVVTTLNGVIAPECNSGSFQTTCFDAFAEFGENGQTFQARVEESTESADILTRFVGSARAEDLSESTRETLNLDIKVNSNIDGFSVEAVLVTNNLVIETYASSFSVNGDYGISTNLPSAANCQSGQLNVTTNVNLQPDSEDNIVAGQLTLMNSGGSSATVTFNANGSADISVNGGAAQTYTQQELEDRCQ